MRKYVLAGDSEKLPKVSKVLKFEGGNKWNWKGISPLSHFFKLKNFLSCENYNIFINYFLWSTSEIKPNFK